MTMLVTKANGRLIGAAVRIPQDTYISRDCCERLALPAAPLAAVTSDLKKWSGIIVDISVWIHTLENEK
jgi:hypothetical protein